MTVKIFDTQEVQDFLRNVAGLDQAGGDPRTKQIMHRVLSDLFRAIDDLDITPDEYWTAVGWFNELGTAGQAGLISPGLGLDHFLDMRLDAIDAELGVENKTPRTIAGPLYVAGARSEENTSELDDGSRSEEHTSELQSL